ncbi:MAG TPA: hypothetical protein VNI57_08025, partial [Candidatus Saccharimonadales bacterium]|nr:hypothetical protein [Candidatus Saccharimonadales bacterium]
MRTSPEITRKPALTASTALLLAALLGAPAALAFLTARPALADDGSGAGQAKKDDKAAKSSKPAKAKEEEHVYTNEDLKRYRGDATVRGRSPGDVVVDMTKQNVPPKAPDTGMDPLVKQRQLAALDKQISQVEARLKWIDDREAALRNPYLRGPKLSEKDLVDEAGKGAKQVVSELGAERDGLTEKLVDLKAQRETLAAA